MGQQYDIRPFMMASDVFVLPSYREGLSTVLVESGAMSLPAITCNVTGCNEIIEDGVNGLLIEPRNTDSLFRAMEKVYCNPQMLKRMGVNARKLVSERYEQSVVWNNYLQEYLKLKDRIKHV
jgi:glycosyltransferase involved in cell wall biosynthesis